MYSKLIGKAKQSKLFLNMSWVINMDAYGLDYPYPDKVIVRKKDLDLNQSLVIRFNKFMVA